MQEPPTPLSAPPRYLDRPFPSEPLELDGGEVPADWLDFNNHMNVGYYALAFDRTVEPFYHDWLDLSHAYAERLRMGPFALQSNLHYLRELRGGQRYAVTLQLIDCDHKRWHFFARMLNVHTGAVAATLEQISMNVDLATRRSAALPDAQQQRLAELMAAHRALPRPEQLGAPIGIRR